MNYQEIVEKWRSIPIKTVEDVEKRLKDFKIVFAFHSNAIEGTGVDTMEETTDIFNFSTIKNYSDEREKLFAVQNQKIAYDFFKEKIAAHEPVSTDLIKELHELVAQGTYGEKLYLQGERPGIYKTHFHGGGDDTGTAPCDVAPEMETLVKEIDRIKNDPEEIVKMAAYFHCKFEKIHPFADGNGPAGRLLLNYYLMTNKMPPLVFFEEDKDRYYDTLAKYDEDGSLDEFIEFIKDETAKSWTLILES